MEAADPIMGVLGRVFTKQSPVKQQRQVLEYSVLNKTECYEERLYPASTWVCTTVTGVYQDTAKIDGFRHLQSYIMGQNKSGAHLTMEPPILTRVSSEGCSSFERKFTVSTYLSSDPIEKHPRPTSDHVFLEHLPETTVFVRTFQGLASEERWTYETKRLAEDLTNREDIRTDYYITATYDSPFHLSADRNEIWLVRYDRLNDSSLTDYEETETVLQVGNLKTPIPPVLSLVLYCVLAYVSFIINAGKTALNISSFVYKNWAGIKQRTSKMITYSTEGQFLSLRSLPKVVGSLAVTAWSTSLTVISSLYSHGEKIKNNNI